MAIRKLIPMVEYTNQILEYVYGSKNYERGIALIKWYNDLLQLPLEESMFTGEKPLFPNFIFSEENRDGITKNVAFSFGENGFGIRRIGIEKRVDNKRRIIETYHLKTVADLCNMELDFDNEYSFVDTDLFD